MATASEIERITRLEEQAKEMTRVIKKMDGKLDTLQSSFDNLTGGKQALMWITATFIALMVLAVGLLNYFKK